jgi:hypothetical protein
MFCGSPHARNPELAEVISISFKSSTVEFISSSLTTMPPDMLKNTALVFLKNVSLYEGVVEKFVQVFLDNQNTTFDFLMECLFISIEANNRRFISSVIEKITEDGPEGKYYDDFNKIFDVILMPLDIEEFAEKLCPKYVQVFLDNQNTTFELLIERLAASIEADNGHFISSVMEKIAEDGPQGKYYDDFAEAIENGTIDIELFAKKVYLKYVQVFLDNQNTTFELLVERLVASAEAENENFILCVMEKIEKDGPEGKYYNDFAEAIENRTIDIGLFDEELRSRLPKREPLVMQPVYEASFFAPSPSPPPPSSPPSSLSDTVDVWQFAQCLHKTLTKSDTLTRNEEELNKLRIHIQERVRQIKNGETIPVSPVVPTAKSTTPADYAAVTQEADKYIQEHSEQIKSGEMSFTGM